MSTTNTAKLHLPHLKYNIADVQHTISEYADFDCFIFLQVFNASNDGMPSLHLLSYAHGNTGKGTPEYHEVYFNADAPDTLTPFDDNIIELDAPVILAPNGISKAAIQKLISESEEAPDALIFIPKINDANLLYYKIKAAKLVSDEYIFIQDDDDSEDTNPSPPATIEFIGSKGA